MDRLSEMWDMQYKLNQRCGVDPNEFESVDQTVTWAKNYLHALNQEGAEFLDSLPWKHWRPVDAQDYDIQNAKVEIVDMFHFLMSLGQVVGMTADEFYSIYKQKNEVNHKRQDSGYTEKDSEDCRHIK